jgi:GT2 family glycosyltransferase
VGPGDDVLAAASQLVSNAATAPGSNIACRRDLLRAIPFDESYTGAGEERDWYARLAADGKAIDLEPRAVVLHYPPPSIGAFWRKHVGYGRGAYRFRRAHRGGRLEDLSFYTRLVRSGFRNGVRIGLAVCLAELATAVGFIAEARAHRA